MHSLAMTSANSPTTPLTLIAGMTPDRLNTALPDTTGGSRELVGAGRATGFGATRGGSTGGAAVTAGRTTGGAGSGVMTGGSTAAGLGACVAPREPDDGCFFRSGRSGR